MVTSHPGPPLSALHVGLRTGKVLLGCGLQPWTVGVENMLETLGFPRELLSLTLDFLLRS